MQNIDLRDVLIVLNILAMVGGGFYFVATLRSDVHHITEMVRSELHNLTRAIENLREWLEKVDGKLQNVSERVAVVEAKSTERK